MSPQRPLVIAYHVIWTGYGCWLPNDPRGSMSHVIASDVIAALGELHHGRKKVQPASRDIRRFHRRAAEALKFPLMEFSREEIARTGETFAEVARRERYTCYACAIMPDHVHLLLRKHKHKAEQMIARFQEASRTCLQGHGRRDADHPIWGGPGWKVFLDTPRSVRRTIRYIADNPRKLRMPAQKWAFVKPYNGWPLHPGHSPNSPYAKRLRACGYRD